MLDLNVDRFQYPPSKQKQVQLAFTVTKLWSPIQVTLETQSGWCWTELVSSVDPLTFEPTTKHNEQTCPTARSCRQ